MFAADDNQLELVELLDVPTEDVLALETALPSSFFPSDHIRMEAVFKIGDR